MPVIHDLTDGMQFDLGGRTVTAYECPGHTAGEMVFIDDQTHLMFAGDALNFNLGIGAVPVETTLKALRRLQARASSMATTTSALWACRWMMIACPP